MLGVTRVVRQPANFVPCCTVPVVPRLYKATRPKQAEGERRYAGGSTCRQSGLNREPDLPHLHLPGDGEHAFPIGAEG